MLPYSSSRRTLWRPFATVLVAIVIFTLLCFLPDRKHNYVKAASVYYSSGLLSHYCFSGDPVLFETNATMFVLWDAFKESLKAFFIPYDAAEKLQKSNKTALNSLDQLSSGLCYGLTDSKGQIVESTHIFVVPKNLVPGTYCVLIAVVSEDGAVQFLLNDPKDWEPIKHKLVVLKTLHESK